MLKIKKDGIKYEKNCIKCKAKFTNLEEYLSHLDESHKYDLLCPKCNGVMHLSRKRLPVYGKVLAIGPNGVLSLMTCEKCSYVELYDFS